MWLLEVVEVFGGVGGGDGGCWWSWRRLLVDVAEVGGGGWL